MNKIFIVIIIAIIAVGGYFILQPSYRETPMPAEEQAVSQKSAEKAPNAEEKVITYTDAGYFPSPLQIKIGDTVTFKNESAQAMWPASAMHPAHKDYPTTGGCIGSAFDACQGVQPGESWPFKFDIVGDWKYHDHLSPKNFGSISVQ